MAAICGVLFKRNIEFNDVLWNSPRSVFYAERGWISMNDIDGSVFTSMIKTYRSHVASSVIMRYNLKFIDINKRPYDKTLYWLD